MGTNRSVAEIEAELAALDRPKRSVAEIEAELAALDAHAPKEDKGWNWGRGNAETLGEQLIGYGKDVVRSVGGQLGRGVGGTIRGAIGDLGGMLPDAINNWSPAAQELLGAESLQDWGYSGKQAFQDYEQEVRDNTTSTPLRVTSELVTGMAGMKGMDMGATLLQKMATGGAAGLGTAITTPDASDAEQALQASLGVGVGTGVPLAVEGLTKLPAKAYTEGLKLIDPYLPGGRTRLAARGVAGAAGDDAMALADALSKAGDDYRTAGQVSSETFKNNPLVPALERHVTPHAPKDYLNVKRSQVAGREKLLDDIGTPEKLARQEAARSAGATREYGAANMVPVESDAKLAAVLADPYSQDAGKLAAKQAQSEKLIPWHGEVPPENASRYLHLVKEGFDKMLSRTGDEALDRTGARTAKGLQRELVKWLREENPAYDVARTRFAARSRGVDQTKAGITLRDTLDKPLASASERAGVFASAMKNMPATLKKATGDTYYKSLDDLFLPSQSAKAREVARQLEAFGKFDEEAKAGARAAKDSLEESLSHLDDLMPRILDRTVVIMRNVLGRVRGKTRGLSEKEIARLMLPQNKPELAQAIRDTTKYATAAEKKELFELLEIGSQRATQVGAQAPIATTGQQ